MVHKWTDENVSHDWFRCEKMSLCQMFLQSESTYDIVSMLGEQGICQFRDLNSSSNAFQRKFVNELRRCVDMENLIQSFEKDIDRDGIPLVDYDIEPSAPTIKEITILETKLEESQNELNDSNVNRMDLKRRLLELTELRHILKHVDQFLHDAQNMNETNSKTLRRMSVIDPKLMRRFSIQINATDVNIPLEKVVDMFTLTGTILTTRFLSFQRMLWRVTHGNILLRRIDIDEKLEDPQTGELQDKCLFILVFQGEKLHKSCLKICEGYRTKLYPVPESAEQRREMFAGVLIQINDLVQVIRQTDELRANFLVAIANNLKQWKVTVTKMRSIYETMNLFSHSITDKCLIAECWIPTNRIGQARIALQNGQIKSNSTIPSALTVIRTDDTPPTLNVTNKFTSGFQNIIDSYGIGNYGEVNPAPYAIISFPFIFAIMFGDTGHGIVMTLFALWLVLSEKKLSKVNGEIFGMFFGGRYLILLMGLFSIYTGLIYNDIFSKSINLFGSSFVATDRDPESWINQTEFDKNEMVLLDPQNDTINGYTYYFGIDPIWQLASNKVLYLNTYKMKLSVILGVLQMFFGVILSLFNHIHFSKWVNIWTEFIPQIIFLLFIFGYMNFMIFYKWFAFNSERSGCAPSILITMINMFMFKQAAEGDPCYLTEELYSGQNIVQSVLIIIAFICVPWMLFIKPFVLLNQSKRTVRKIPDHQIELKSSSTEISNGSSDTTTINVEPQTSGVVETHSNENKFDFADTFINQSIHTIEYCLGSVSHTASYLRLWALSLAHAELSEVLWSMVMANGFIQLHDGPPGVGNIYSAIVMFLVFGFWSGATVIILIVMEGLSAFLHALRLHWVEFMSKFYTGSGYAFEPFYFKKIINQR